MPFAGAGPWIQAGKPSPIRAENREHLEALTGPKTVDEVQRYLIKHDLPMLR